MRQMTLEQAAEMAMEHMRAGRPGQAISLFRQVLAIQPDHPGVMLSLGIALHGAGQLNESLATFERIVKLQPKWPDGWNNYGVLLHQLGKLEEAAAAFRTAMAHGGETSAALNNLGAVLQDMGQPQDAIPLHQKAILLQPASVGAYSNLANALKFSGRLDESISVYRRAMAVAPDDPVIHHHLGLTLLYSGDFEHGFEEHEWRCRIKRPRPLCLDFPQPRWDGGPVRGQRILIHAEQGFGDTLLFARYIPLVAAQGGKVIFQCQNELVRLMQDSLNVEQVISQSEPLPPFDLHCPLMSLPYVFKTTPATIPAPPGYIRSNQERATRWRARIQKQPERIKVGIVWAGKMTNSDDRQRSVALAMLAPLAEIQDIRFFSLQKGPAAIETQQVLPRLRLTEWTSELNDFAETAAVIENLDLVIGVDTAVVHLAGAMGKHVWVLVPFVPDWRWMQGRCDSPWYLSARLFRQPASGDWSTPISNAAAALWELASK